METEWITVVTSLPAIIKRTATMAPPHTLQRLADRLFGRIQSSSVETG
jgi:hypothetical protein